MSPRAGSAYRAKWWPAVEVVKDTQLDFRFGAPRRVWGQVVGPGGGPLTRAAVHVQGADPAVDTTVVARDDGQYSLRLLDGTYTFTVNPGLESPWAAEPATLAVAGDAVVDLSLNRVLEGGGWRKVLARTAPVPVLLVGRTYPWLLYAAGARELLRSADQGATWTTVLEVEGDVLDAAVSGATLYALVVRAAYDSADQTPHYVYALHRSDDWGDLPAAADVDLAAYNRAGQRAASLCRGRRAAEVHRVQWDGRDDGGVALASGLYVYRLRAGERQQARKLLLVR